MSEEFRLIDRFIRERGTGRSGVVASYKMRGRDSGRAPGSDYITWITTGEPDFAGAGYATGTPTPIGSMVANSAVVVDILKGL